MPKACLNDVDRRSVLELVKHRHRGDRRFRRLQRGRGLGDDVGVRDGARPPIEEQTTVRVTCRVRGFKVESGNEWWYLVASSPWEKKFFATADAFYNQQKTTGPLSGTPFVDSRVPNCR